MLNIIHTYTQYQKHTIREALHLIDSKRESLYAIFQRKGSGCERNQKLMGAYMHAYKLLVDYISRPFRLMKHQRWLEMK